MQHPNRNPANKYFIVNYSDGGGTCTTIQPFRRLRAAKKYARRKGAGRYNWAVILAPDHKLASKWAGELWEEMQNGAFYPKINDPKPRPELTRYGIQRVAFIAPWRLCVKAWHSLDGDPDCQSELIEQENGDWAILCNAAAAAGAGTYNHPAAAAGALPPSVWSDFVESAFVAPAPNPHHHLPHGSPGAINPFVVLASAFPKCYTPATWSAIPSHVVLASAFPKCYTQHNLNTPQTAKNTGVFAVLCYVLALTCHPHKKNPIQATSGLIQGKIPSH